MTSSDSPSSVATRARYHKTSPSAACGARKSLSPMLPPAPRQAAGSCSLRGWHPTSPALCGGAKGFRRSPSASPRAPSSVGQSLLQIALRAAVPPSLQFFTLLHADACLVVPGASIPPAVTLVPKGGAILSRARLGRDDLDRDALIDVG
jgi:hypothetical protein